MLKKRKPRKDGRYSINLSFTQAEENLIEYVDSKGSFTNYVKYLIRKDMEGEKGISPELLQELLKNNIQNQQQTPQPKEEQKEEAPKKKKINMGAMNNILGKKF